MRIGRFLEREGLLERDAENSDLASDAVDEDPMDQLLGHSITYRIDIGPQAGRKVFTRHKIAGSNFGRWSEAMAAPRQRGEAQECAEQTLPVCDADDTFSGKVDGFSLHAGVAAKAHERKKLERLCRHISRPVVFRKAPVTDRGRQNPLSTEDTLPGWDDACDVTPGILPSALRASLRLFKITPGDFVEPLDFIARLAALVPKPRVNLTRFARIIPDTRPLRY